MRLLLFIIFLSFTPYAAHALDSCVVPNGLTYYIDEFSECREVTNATAGGLSIMVPTKTANEWSTGGISFLDNPPAGVTLVSCGSAITSCENTVCPTNGLVSYWRLDEAAGTTVVDSISGLNGTRTGATISTSGKINNALSFDASGDYVAVPDNAAF